MNSSKTSTENSSKKFTEAHKALLSGLVASKMPMHECLDILLNLDEFQAATLFVNYFDMVEERMEFPTREEIMNMVKSTPERVKSYFKDKHVSYAADSQ